MTPNLRPANHILRAMEADAFEHVRPDLRRLKVEKGDILIAQGQVVDIVHFPVDAVLGNVVALKDGSAIETAAVGRDSVTGMAAVFARSPIAWSVQVQVAGEVWTLRADRLNRAMDECDQLRDLLMRVIYDAQSQAALAAACHAEHDVLQRLSKWILLLADRTNGSTLALTQQEIADLLGTERTTINVAIQTLKDRGAISLSRGKMALLDHRVLERSACECYASQRAWTQRLGLPVEPIKLADVR